jgi:hypothetical protein
MAKDKRSFILYSDIYFTVAKLKDEQAGKLFKHILGYVNDENPVMDDVIIEIAFEPIKQALKRDLRKYEIIRDKRSLAGKASADKRQQVLTSVDSSKQVSTVNDSVIVNDNVNDKKIIAREIKFKSEVFEFTEYSEALLNKFCNYWTEKNKSKTKMRFELEKTFEINRRLVTWSNKDKDFTKEPKSEILKIKTGAFNR